MNAEAGSRAQWQQDLQDTWRKTLTAAEHAVAVSPPAAAAAAEPTHRARDDRSVLYS